MQIKQAKIETLKADPKNARLHDNRNIEAIRKSLEEFGQQKPIVVSEEGQIIAGNGTFQAAKKLGWKEIAVVRTKLKAEEAIAFAIADNRTAELAKWDLEALTEMYEKLSVDARKVTGFTDEEVAKLLGPETDASVNDNLDDVEYRVIVTVDGPDGQAELINELEGRGLPCLPLMS